MKKGMSLLLALVLVIATFTMASFSVSAEDITSAPASDWEPVVANGKVSVASVEGGTKINFNNTTWGGDYLVATKKAYKLDGLYLNMANIHLSAANYGLNISLSKNAKSLENQELIFLANNFGSDIYKNGNVKVGVSVSPMRDNERVGLFILAYKNADGSFTFEAGGTETKCQFTLTKEEVTTMWGSDDPSVYLTMTDNWYNNGAAADNSLVVRELSTGNANMFTSYSDPWGRDLFATQKGVLENITIEHYGNQGAFANLTHKLPLAGLTIADVEMDYSAMFRFSVNRCVLADNGYVGGEEGKAGFLIRVDKEAGNIYCTYTTGGGTEDEIVGNLEEGFTKFTLQLVLQKDGSYVVYIISDKNTVKIPLAKDDLTWAFGDLTDLKVNVGYSSFNNDKKAMKIVKIGKIYNETDFAATAPATATATIKDRALSVQTTDANPDMVLSYQWFENSKDSNQGGTAINGATAAAYTIPAGLKAGDHYFYCVVTATSKSGDAKSISSNAVTFQVAANEKTTATTTTTKATATTAKPTNGTHNHVSNTDTGSAPIFGVAALLLLSAGAVVLCKKKK